MHSSLRVPHCSLQTPLRALCKVSWRCSWLWQCGPLWSSYRYELSNTTSGDLLAQRDLSGGETRACTSFVIRERGRDFEGCCKSLAECRCWLVNRRCSGAKRKVPHRAHDSLRPEHADQPPFINSYTFMERLVSHFKPDQVVVTESGHEILTGFTKSSSWRNGRRAALRSQWATVQVRFLSRTPRRR